ncbi:MAG: endonuclease III domain-containing protein [Sulfurimonas sp.]|uniref:endonuclease III domain-containing protein n=1 Tax=Sulfurimonas sp. TaxID=2022749 RepID=UPI0026177CBF|nr:endonuclease III domain-containing protein [Sulfurimonas sp.]MCW8894744.1 endonuclease III domain-containing protein [Sulfurimonas sp.]MCW8954611.1 endonuclease III domain-containing protein [Sulfurimonas sp.]MCW9067543.1 endonuclease III domain-containing protein [Sulfurimonas sp.]
MNKIYKIYRLLYKTYGPQGWWPFINLQKSYHPLDYSFPRNSDEIFEVCLGSILTQNTTFISVVKSLNNLHVKEALNLNTIESMDIDELKTAIRPSGYHNQKARYILEFIKFYRSLDGAIPTREALLHVVGIGPETADSILLYGYNQCEFKVDAYTQRLLLTLGLIDEKAKYHDIKYLMEDSLKECIKDEKELLITYQEFHALIVNHAKKFYSKKPYGERCFLEEVQSSL